MNRKRFSLSEAIEEQLCRLNELRERNGKIKLKRFWTGVAHRLYTDEADYKEYGGLYMSDNGFLGFLDGLIKGEEEAAEKLIESPVI